MPNQKPNAITLNLCPDCGAPPYLTIYSDGSANCHCADFECESYDVYNADTWQAAIERWNENTAKAYAERSESPISDNGEYEPPHVENGAQNGAECDTREKVLADLERLARKWHDYDGNFMRIYNHVAYAQVKELLDRQAAISERELCAKCEWPSLAAMPDIEQQKRIAEQDRRIVEYAEQVDSLTAERDELQCERNAAISRASYMESAAAEELAKLLGENETIEVYDDKIHGKRRIVTGTQRKLEKQVTELTAERDSLRERLKTQANSFQKLERDNAKLRDTLARVRELAGDAQ